MTRGTLPLDWRGGTLPSVHFHISLWTNLCGRTRRNIGLLDCQKAGRLYVNRTALSLHFTGLNPLQPKRTFSSLDRVSLVPAAESWAVRLGPPVSAALAGFGGFPGFCPHPGSWGR